MTSESYSFGAAEAAPQQGFWTGSSQSPSTAEPKATADWRSLAALLIGLSCAFLAAPAAAQTVSFSATNYPVWEGDAAQVEVVLSESRRTDTTVELHPIALSATGQGIDFIDQRYTVTIPRYETRGTGTIRTVQDARKELTEQFRLDIVTSSLPAGVTLGAPHPTYVNIQDDDQDAGSLPRLSIARYGKYVPGQSGGFYAPVVEGTAASFSVTVSTDWAAPEELTVTLEVSEETGEGQNFVAPGNEGAQTMTIHPWRDGAAKIYQVPTANDGSRLADGAVTVRLVPSDDYHVEVGRHWATVEVADDDHPRGLILESSTPMFGGLTMPEDGGGGYTVRLASAPTGDVTVTWTRRDDGDGDGDWSNVHISPASMTFTRDNWFETQLMYVRGDRDNDGDNDRFSIVHTASGGGYGGVSDYMRVGVVEPDIPDISAPPPDEYVPNDWALKPSGIAAGGRFRLLFLTAARNASDTDIATYNTFVQTEAAGGHTAIQTYSSQFKVVGSTAAVSARDNTMTTGAGDGVPIYWLNGNKVADDYNDFWDGSWNAQMSSDTRGASGMAVSGALRVWTGTQTNGGIHSDSLGSSNVRYGAWGSGTNPISQGTDSGSGARRMLAMSPLFEVSSGTGQGSDSIGHSDSTDSVEDDGGTETGNTQLPDYSALKATVRGYADETQHGDDHVNRWKRALAGLGDGDAIAEGYKPMTADEAQDMADAYSASRWDPVVEALTELESRRTAEPEPDPIPELSLSAGSAVDEGASASFTIHAHPAPASGLTVSVTVSQSGDYLDSPGAGSRTVTLAAGASTASLAIATVNDGADESDGSVSVSIDSGAGYAVAPSNHTASVTVRDNDDPPPPARTLGACVSVSQWDTVEGYYDRNSGRSPNYGANWYRVLIAYHPDRSDQTLPDWVGSTPKPSSAFTVADAEDEEETWAGWTPIRKVLQCLDKESGQSFVPLLPGSSNPAYGGVVRFVNPSPQGGSVQITATDDSGWSPDPVTLYVGPGQSIDLTTRDLEQGNIAKGLTGALGWGTGNWRLDVSGQPDASGRPGIQVQPYVRAYDGRLAPMHGIAEVEQGIHHVPTFTPAGGAANDPSGRPTGRRNQADLHQAGLLRLINRGHEALTARITGTDDSGRRGGEASVDIPPREALLVNAAELEGGGAGLRGALGDGQGMWRLHIASSGDLAVMSLQSSGGHLTNLSGSASPALRSSAIQAVPYFPSASDPQGRQGVIRIINDTAIDVPVHVQPRDDTARRYEPLTLVVRAGEAVHLDSWDLELGDPSSGLSGSTGAGMGDWRLDIASWPGVEVLAYVRSLNGALVPVRDLVDEAEQSHEAAR